MGGMASVGESPLKGAPSVLRTTAPDASARSESGEVVVLVHGLWMHGLAFALQRRRLRRRGFVVHAFSYRSVRRGLADNIQALARFVDGLAAPAVHLVGHSLGGLIILGLLSQRPPPPAGRVVLLGSPCAGSHAATLVSRLPALSIVLGRSMSDWLRLPPPKLPEGVEIGVLSGSRALGIGRVMPGMPVPNDGVVAVSETRLAAATDEITLPLTHSQMLLSARCADQVVAFLMAGRFQHPSDRG